MSAARQPDAEFRWQSLFQRADDPFFLLDRRRRFLFVNHAWELLTGLSAAEARGLQCQPRSAGAGEPHDVLVRAACCPPPEVLAGQPGRVRRLVPGSRWWDVEFLPLANADGLLAVLGKIAFQPEPATLSKEEIAAPLAERLTRLHETLARLLDDEHRSRFWQPEALVGLRERLLRRHALEHLHSELPAFGRVVDQARLTARSRTSALIVGEAGTGKQWLARTIHALGQPGQPFFALDCAHLPRQLLQGLLNGGLSALTRTGTLYLREPSLLPQDLQRRVLDLLHEDPTTRLHILAGSSAEPAEEVVAGRLLEDLHSALGTVVIALPPLRERRADLGWLVEKFLERLNVDGERTVAGLTDAAWGVVRAYRWPGNLRELHAALASGRRHATGEWIDTADLPGPLRLAVGMGETAGLAVERPMHLDQMLEEVERRLIQMALRKAQGNKTRAAELLSVWRPRLLRRMEALGISDSGKE